MTKIAVWWVRRDLRLSDNQALAAALARAERVLPLYIFEKPSGASPVNGKRSAFLRGGLWQLDNDLRSRGSRLVLRRGDPETVLASVMNASGASVIFAQEEYSPEATVRDAAVAASLPLVLTGDLSVQPPDAMREVDGEPYTVLTPYRKAWKALPLPQARDVLQSPARLLAPPSVESLSIQEAKPSGSLLFPPGEAEAQGRLRAFVDGLGDRGSGYPAPIYRYDEQRRRLDLDATSRLSPYLSFGMLSARQAVVSALSAIDAAPNAEAAYSAEAWLNALIWREFATSISYHYPMSLQHGFRAELRKVPWENNITAFAAWKEGRTGYPLVDAAMRQLVQTGWLHHQARLVTASFLVKDLLVDWRWGEQFFAQHLLDSDQAANNEGWQRAAGAGTGPAPYLGILNPALQGKRYDPEGVYVRRWVPELAAVPVRYVHQPSLMPADTQRQSGCVIGRDYPAPIVDHGWARDRAMEFFRTTPEPMQVF